MVTHVLVLQTQERLVLVDCGVSAADVASASRRLGRGWMFVTRPTLQRELTARHQITALGLNPDRVSDIVLTHMDLDHCGGMSDFPNARVHVSWSEYRAATAARRGRAARRYRPVQWEHDPRWETYELSDQPSWRGIAGSVRIDVPGVELHLVPLSGHSAGHCGVAVSTDDGWLFHAGSAYSIDAQLRGDAPRPYALRWRYRWFERWIATAPRELATSLDTVRSLARVPDVTVICSHDGLVFDACIAAGC
jgi:glyoxylase-like metal-dependent hydrolase (beta-lactamase superfamily II)